MFTLLIKPQAWNLNSCSNCIRFSILRHFRKNNASTKTKISILPKESTDVGHCIGLQYENVGFRSLLKPLIFTVCFSGSCFVCATIWQYEDMKRKAKFWIEKNSWFENVNKPTYKRGSLRRELNTWWHRHTEGQKVALGIIFINTLVFLMWKIPRLQPFMQSYFCCSPASRAKCLSMFTAVFSHYSFFHLATNMYVLYSFSSTSVAFFGKEQFLSLYLSAGVLSSFTSYLYKVAVGRYVLSLGASGALMAVLSTTCFQFPNTQLAIVFLPFFTLSAGHAIKIIMALDTIGILARWRLLDHAAHLGGALFGIFYLYYGSHYIWGNREPLIVLWKNVTERFTK